MSAPLCCQQPMQARFDQMVWVCMQCDAVVTERDRYDNRELEATARWLSPLHPLVQLDDQLRRLS